MLTKDRPLTFIGPGVMAEAMLIALLREERIQAETIRVSGPRAARVDALADRYRVQPFTDNRAAVAQASVIILAVKPQQLDAVFRDLQGAIPADALVLSIIAGASLQKLSQGLAHKAIVRAMPNTPARIQAGITVWTATAAVAGAQQALARSLLQAMGSEIQVQEEKYLDMATALSGTGPAYVFLFMEAMIDAGVHMGFPRRIAEQLVSETLLGSVRFYQQQNGKHVAALRNQVTSPGGTSAEALYYLEKAGFRTALSRAIWAAYQRSLDLASQPRHPHIPPDTD